MADLQEELQAILGDPQAMGQITAIARALTERMGGTIAAWYEGGRLWVSACFPPASLK